MRSIGSPRMVDENENKRKITKFVGFSQFGDEGDMSGSFSYGGYGFDVNDGVLQAALDDLLVDDITQAGGDVNISSLLFHTRVVAASGDTETFLLAKLDFTVYEPFSVNSGIWVRYLPSNPIDAAYPTAWMNIAGAESITSRCGSSFVNYQDGTTNIVIMSNRNGYLLKWAGGYTGELLEKTPNNVEKLNASAPKGDLLAMYEDRLFVAGIYGQPNAVYWSEKMNVAGWTISTDGAGYLNVVQGHGEVISALFASRIGLLIFKKDSFYRLTGAVPADYKFDVVSTEYGAVNNKCVCELNNVTYFLDRSGPIMYTDGINVYPLLRGHIPVEITIYNEMNFSLFAYNDHLYFFDSTTFDYFLYKINPRENAVVGVKAIGMIYSVPCWIPMYSRCFYAVHKQVSSVYHIYLRALEENTGYLPYQWVVPQSDFGDLATIKTINKVKVRGSGGRCRIIPVVDDEDQPSVWVDLPTLTAYYGGVNAYTNLVPNGDMAGTTGWAAGNSVLSVWNGYLVISGNGVSEFPLALTTLPWEWTSGHKVYIRALMTVDNASALILGVALKGSGSGHVDSMSQAAPSMAVEYSLSGISTLDAGAGSIQLYGFAVYESSAVASGKNLLMDKVMCIDLTAIYGAGNEPSLVECDAIYPFVAGSGFISGYTPKSEGIDTVNLYSRGRMIGFKIENGDALKNGDYCPTNVKDIQIHFESEDE